MSTTNHAELKRKAAEYLQKVRETDKMTEFSQLTKDLNNHTIDQTEAIEKIRILFHDRPELVEGFYTFLPKATPIQRNWDRLPELRVSSDVKLPESFTAIFLEAQRLILELRQRDEEKNRLLVRILNENRHSMVQMDHELAVAFEDDLELLSELARFLPKVFHSQSRVVQILESRSRTVHRPFGHVRALESKLQTPQEPVDDEPEQHSIPLDELTPGQRDLYSKILDLAPVSSTQLKKWKVFLRCLALYNADIISATELLLFAKDALTRRRLSNFWALMPASFKRDLEDKDMALLREIFPSIYSAPAPERRRRARHTTTATPTVHVRCQVSYRELTSEERSALVASCLDTPAGRLANSVLNFQVVSEPTGSETGYSTEQFFMPSQEALGRFEEDLVRFDDVITKISSLLRAVLERCAFLEDLPGDAEEAALIRSLAPDFQDLHWTLLADLYNSSPDVLNDYLQLNPAAWRLIADRLSHVMNFLHRERFQQIQHGVHDLDDALLACEDSNAEYLMSYYIRMCPLVDSPIPIIIEHVQPAIHLLQGAVELDFSHFTMPFLGMSLSVADPTEIEYSVKKTEKFIVSSELLQFIRWCYVVSRGFCQVDLSKIHTILDGQADNDPERTMVKLALLAISDILPFLNCPRCLALAGLSDLRLARALVPNSPLYLVKRSTLENGSVQLDVSSTSSSISELTKLHHLLPTHVRPQMAFSRHLTNANFDLVWAADDLPEGTIIDNSIEYHFLEGSCMMRVKPGLTDFLFVPRKKPVSPRYERLEPLSSNLVLLALNREQKEVESFDEISLSPLSDELS